MSSPKTFEQAIEASHRALDEITRGNPEPFFELYSSHTSHDLVRMRTYWEQPPICGACFSASDLGEVPDGRP